MKEVDGLKYTKEHEWVRVDNNNVFVGITDYAQEKLGDIVFIELPEMGADLKKGDVIGVVDSVKAASEIYTPVAGKVVQINEVLTEKPEKLNENPYESWIAVLELEDTAQLDSLMDTQEYKVFCAKEK